MASGLVSIDPKYTLDAQQARQNGLVAVTIGMTFLGVICVVCRIFTRSFIVGSVTIGDWIMVAAATLTVTYMLEIIAGAKLFKLGFSGMSITTEDKIGIIQVILAIVITYKAVVTLIKISILLMYLRLVVNRTFHLLCKGTIAILTLYQIIVVIGTLTQCVPLHKLWDFTGLVPGRCINANVFFHAASVFHITMDLWILILPLRLIMQIPRPPREKVALYIIFGLGIFAMVASIVRLQFLRIFTLSKDPFYDALPINLWSMVEVNIGMLCASIPTLKPLVSKVQRHRSSANDTTSLGESKLPVLRTGKDLMISLHPATFKGDMKTVDQEWELYDRPPRPPPKDEKFLVRLHSLKYPDMTHDRI